MPGWWAMADTMLEPTEWFRVCLVTSETAAGESFRRVLPVTPVTVASSRFTCPKNISVESGDTCADIPIADENIVSAKNFFIFYTDFFVALNVRERRVSLILKKISEAYARQTTGGARRALESARRERGTRCRKGKSTTKNVIYSIVGAWLHTRYGKEEN